MRTEYGDRDAAVDPTMQLLRELDDPSKYMRKDGVAVFKPHERAIPAHTDAAGNKVPGRTIRVTAADLDEIAANTNRRYADDGEPVRLTVGHRRHEPGFPEKDQPAVVGYGRGLRAEVVDRPGGKAIRLTQTEYLSRSHYAAVRGQYPGRSPEYDPTEKVITGVALLTRDPFLGLGAVSYDGAGRLTYAMGMDMNDDLNAIPGVAPAVGGDVDPVMYEMFKKCFAKYMSEQGGGLPGGLPGGLDGNPLTPAPYAATVQAVTYARDIADMKAQFAAEKAARVAAECRSLLDPLKDARQFDYARELATLVNYQTDVQRAAHVQYIAANYLPLPTGPGVRVYQGDVTPAGAGGGSDFDPWKAPPEHDKIMLYMKSTPGMSYEKAATELALRRA